MDGNLCQTPGQVSSNEVGQIFREHIRGCVREMISEVMAAEVSELCGPKHHPIESDHFRTGSCSGRVLFEGEREELGSSESAEVARDLMRRLIKRGFHCDRPLLSVLDGSARCDQR